MKITPKLLVNLARSASSKALLAGCMLVTTYGCKSINAAYEAVKEAKSIESKMNSYESVREAERKRLELLSKQTGDYIDQHGESSATEETNNLLKGKMAFEKTQRYRIVEYKDLRLVKYSIFAPKVFCGELRQEKEVIRSGKYVWEEEKEFHQFIASPLDIEIEYQSLDEIKRSNGGSVAYWKACR